ncbi:MAG: DMT family transporter [Peptostreptococcaceae bacterium]|nr:DMT family transporter [Peptostreptococcaceae bacterium]
MLIMGLAMAIVAGIFIAFQGNINALVASQTSIYTVILIPVLTQSAILGAVLLLNRQYVSGVVKIAKVDYGMLLLVISGILGLGIMATITFSIMEIGPVTTYTVAIFSQLFAATLIEHYGLIGVGQNSISPFRILGLILMVVAVKLFYM